VLRGVNSDVKRNTKYNIGAKETQFFVDALKKESSDGGGKKQQNEKGKGRRRGRSEYQKGLHRCVGHSGKMGCGKSGRGKTVD